MHVGAMPTEASTLIWLTLTALRPPTLPPAELPGGFDNVFYMLYSAAATAGALLVQAPWLPDRALGVVWWWLSTAQQLPACLPLTASSISLSPPSLASSLLPPRNPTDLCQACC